MLEQLADEVVLVATDRIASAPANDQYRYAVLPNQPSLPQRLLNRLGLLKTCPWTCFEADWMQQLARHPQVDRIVVHFLTWGRRFSDAWRLVKKPVFIFCHGYDVSWDMRTPNGKRYHDDQYVQQVLCLPENVVFVANSQVTRERLLQIGIADQRIKVYHAGVPTTDTPKKHCDKSEVTILYLGRLVDCKGPDRVIQAFDLACRLGLRARLQIAGDGPMRQCCETLASESEFVSKIQFLGSVDVHTGEELRRRADIFTAHSQKGPVTGQEEAYGISFLEAMATGLPVLSGQSGALPEILRDGVDGVLFAPGDVQAHAEAMLTLANSSELRNQFGQSAWQHVRTHFNQDVQTLELQKLLRMNCPHGRSDYSQQVPEDASA